MIRNESEYQEAGKRLKEERARLARYRKSLEAEGLSAPEVKRALDPLRSFHLQLDEEVHRYERLKRGDFDEFVNFQGLGQTLIGLRIAQGLTQNELADRLGVHETQVSRDERNEYHGITVERATKVLAALQAELTTSIGSVIPLVEPTGVKRVTVRRTASRGKARARKSASRSHSAHN
jgi:transcriptional regulator with XRE-family HTH domain